MSHSVNLLPIAVPPAVPGAEIEELSWFALHTRARHENAVARQLGGREIQHLLPSYQAARRWKDRTKILTLPLFPGYVFVRINRSQVLGVLQLPGAAKLVGFPRPQPIQEEEIDRLQQCALFPHLLEPHPYLRVGSRARVRSGPLAEIEGILLRRKSDLRLVISIELIQRSVALEIDAADVVPV